MTMNKINIRVIIDNEEYTKKQLQLIKFEREKHVLQEMIHLGAVIIKDNQELSYDDVNYFSYKEAELVNKQAKEQLGVDQIRTLYANELKKSAQMWRDIVSDFNAEDDMFKATADIQVEGMKLNQFKDKLMSVLSGKDYSVLSEHPEHFQFTTSIDNNDNEKIGMETMGMYGGPTEVIVMMGDKALNEKVKSNAGFPDAPCGTSRLVDGTLRKDIAHHQMRETENGFEILTTVYFPKNTPIEMVEGHKLHLAMETYEMICSAANS